MTTTVKLSGTDVIFPPVCVVCAAPVEDEYRIERTFVYGRRSILIRLPVPMCAAHAAQAKSQSRGEVVCERMGRLLGVLLGLGAMGGLLIYWSGAGLGTGLLNWLLAAFVGLGLGLSAYVAARFWLAPTLAAPETKAIRHSVRLNRFWPARNVLELTFDNAHIAAWTAQLNGADSLPAPSPQRYLIRANLLCHDVRLNTHVETVAQLDHSPTMAEAERLLWPVANALVARYDCEDCPYDLSDIAITAETGH
jgi:hypothetical protein